MSKDKEKIFIDAYLLHFNGVRAMKEAGYSEKSNYYAGRLLNKPRIKEEINKRMNEVMDDNRILIRRVISELEDIAFADVGDYVKIEEIEKAVDTEDGGVQIVKEKSVVVQSWEDLNTNAIQGVRNGKYGIEMVFHDKLKALDMLGKYLQLWKETANIQINNNITTESQYTDEQIKQISMIISDGK